MSRAIRSELLKMKTMPGMWVVLLLAFPLTALFVLALRRARAGETAQAAQPTGASELIASTLGSAA